MLLPYSRLHGLCPPITQMRQEPDVVLDRVMVFLGLDLDLKRRKSEVGWDAIQIQRWGCKAVPSSH